MQGDYHSLYESLRSVNVLGLGRFSKISGLDWRSRIEWMHTCSECTRGVRDHSEVQKTEQEEEVITERGSNSLHVFTTIISMTLRNTVFSSVLLLAKRA